MSNQVQLATLCYLQHDGKTLMLFRNKKKHDVHEGKWNGLGGKFLPGETPEECVLREVKEESGLILTKPRLKGVISFPNFTEGQDWMVFVFTASEFYGSLLESKEGKLEWIQNDKLFSLSLWEGDKIFMTWLGGSEFFSARFVYKNKNLINRTVTFY